MLPIISCMPLTAMHNGFSLMTSWKLIHTYISQRSMRINVTWPLCVCACVWCVSAPEPHPKHERQRRTNIWGCVIISVLQMCHDPPFGTVRVNPISRGINGRPTAVEKDAGTWLFWLTSSESDEGCGTTLGGKAERRRRKSTLPGLVRRDCILHAAGKSHRTRSVTKHTALQVADSSEGLRTQTKRRRRRRARR